MNDNSTGSSHSSLAEDFEWDASEATVTAWSQTTSTQPVRRRGAFGTRGTGRSARFRAKKPQLSRESSSEESGLFGRDSPSPEKNLFSRDNVVEEDCATDFPSDVMPRRVPPKLTRSVSITAKSLPSVPKPMRMGRSMSLSLVSGYARDVSESSLADESPLQSWSENANPNHLDELLEAELESGGSRKKQFRQSRRSSIHGSTTPLSDLMSSSIQHVGGLKTDIGTPVWLNPDKMSPPKGLDFGDLTDCGPSKGLDFGDLTDCGPPPKGLDFGDLTDCGPTSPARSVASSRKRGINGSPISDIDDWSSNGLSINSSSSRSAHHSRSRSRILCSPVPDLPLPFAPPMTRRRNENELRPMEVESDGHASDSDSNGGNDTSFESASDRPSFPLALGKQPIKSSESDGDIFQTMSSYQDLKFLIKTLRQESEGRCAMGNSWNVAPPAGWTSSRRAAFFQWSTRNLGFDVRATGGSFNYLQISKTRGDEVLSKLEEALISYKQKEVDKQKESAPNINHDSFSFMDTSCSARKPAAERRYVLN
jgi:hypothetical protein